MTDPTASPTPEEWRALQDKCADLEHRLERAGLLKEPGADAINGKMVVVVVASGMLVAIVAALLIFNMAKTTARKRDAARKAAKTSASRVALAHHQAALGVQRCAVSEGGGAPLSITLRSNLTPKGKLVLLEAGVTPRDPELIRCVRKVPAEVSVPENLQENVAELVLRITRGERVAAKTEWSISAEKVTGATPAHPKQLVGIWPESARHEALAKGMAVWRRAASVLKRPGARFVVCYEVASNALVGICSDSYSLNGGCFCSSPNL